MAKTIVRVATMGAGKSTHLLRVAYNYEQVGFNILVVKPSFDTRDCNLVQSRIGISRPCDVVLDESDNIFEIAKEKHQNNELEAVLVDEANFLTKEQAVQLLRVSAQLDITVIAYGIKSSYVGGGFEGMNQLMAIADKIEEPVKCIDRTGKKCTMHLRSVDGKYVFDGDSCIVGDIKGVEKYESCTAKKWFHEYDKYLQLKED